jgi:hypothetical protein
MRLILSFLLFIVTNNVKAQQWVMNEIAEDNRISEPTPIWIIVLVVILGYFIYKIIPKKDDETQERLIKEREIDERNLEENIKENSDNNEDVVDIFCEDDNLIIPTLKDTRSIETSKKNVESNITQIETDFYIISQDSKEFIIAKDNDFIDIPKGVESIKSYAFSDKKVRKISIPNTVKTIEPFAFSGCLIEKIIIPNTIVNFGEFIFYGCNKLKEVVLEEGLKTFGVGMFSNCTSLEEVRLPQTLITIPNSAFDFCSSLQHITLPPNLVRIGDSAFSYCQSLVEINIPPTVKDIGFSAFRQCAIPKIIIPKSIYGIAQYMFYDNYKLKEVVLPNTITCIMSHAFYGCENLHVVIPPTVTYIAPDAFLQCNDYSYDKLHIEVPKGKKEKLEIICDKLIGKISEYETNNIKNISDQLQNNKKKFIELHLLKEKENMRNIEPIFYHGARVAFKFEEHCTYNNFE